MILLIVLAAVLKQRFIVVIFDVPFLSLYMCIIIARNYHLMHRLSQLLFMGRNKSSKVDSSKALCVRHYSSHEMKESAMFVFNI